MNPSIPKLRFRGKHFLAQLINPMLKRRSNTLNPFGPHADMMARVLAMRERLLALM